MPVSAAPGRPAVDTVAVEQMLAKALRPALEEIAAREVPVIEEAISVPVERDFAGNVIVRSLPGQPPRLEEGVLHANIDHHLADEGGEPVLYITAARPAEGPGDDENAAQILEFGGVGNWGPVEPRPFMGPAAKRIESYAVEVFAKHLAEQLK